MQLQLPVDLDNQPAGDEQWHQAFVQLWLDEGLDGVQVQVAADIQFGLGVGQPGFFRTISTSLAVVVAKRRWVTWPWKSKVWAKA